METKEFRRAYLAGCVCVSFPRGIGSTLTSDILSIPFLFILQQAMMMVFQGTIWKIRRLSTIYVPLLANNAAKKPHEHFRFISSLLPDQPRHHRHRYDHNAANKRIVVRSHRASSSWSFLPDALQSISIWGGSGYLLKALNASTGMPYWAAFAAISVGVRTALMPVVVYGAQTASRFAKILPDVQFQLSLFQRDMKTYRDKKATLPQILYLMRVNLATLSDTYRLHKVNPFSVFLSPLLQIPIFMYISTDLRKILNGLDPALAQQLVDTSILWVPDLTEPDPWFGLPIICGVLLYANVEVSMGRRSMAGESMAKADTPVFTKDLFQSLGIFMPCFTSQLPAGMQIYVATSFCFTMAQSVALRNDSFRAMVGLPSMLAKPPEGKYSKQLIELKKLEFKAKEIRGDGPLLGKGVLMYGWEVSFPGSRRPSTIQVERGRSDQNDTRIVEPFAIEPYTVEIEKKYRLTQPKLVSKVMAKTPYVPGVSAPPWQVERQQREAIAAVTNVGTIDNIREHLPTFSDDIIEKANRGEMPREVQFMEQPLVAPTTNRLSAKSLMRRKQKSKKRR
jgi:membrane protein insertase Oxa1/YidC/SpoIIIJ